MTDATIVSLYWQRDETAIKETEIKFGKYLTKIAYNILADNEDSEESVNDTFLKAWNSMPTHKPNELSTYLGKITRELSIDAYRKRNRQKRAASQYALSLTEIEECVPANNNPALEVETKLLDDLINSYLFTVSKDMRDVFLCRYYFMDSIKDISAKHNMSVSKVKSMLRRVRLGLRTHLEKGGFSV
ncbi:MAG: RNA polymerase sigma factor [Oscillospiraceae bacterium]|jgi:RNA polymerase sigma-70 factor (ECF subfamily)|nr:RNA polymerase sigma factor [Oscillospiraceae bacterium]